MKNASSPKADTSSIKQRVYRRLDGLRIKIGASRGQLATLGLLLIIGGTFIARPAGMLLWHRLRIITGMPRMAVANQDPAQIAHAGPIPNRLDPGRPVVLDDFLVRDPFRAPMPNQSDNAAVIAATALSLSNDAEVVIELDMQSDRIVHAASLIRLSGTANGLGTALLDGSVRQLGDSIESGTVIFTLHEVRSGEVILEFTPSDGGSAVLIVLTRSGARIALNR